MPKIFNPNIDAIVSFIISNFYTPFTITRNVDGHLVTIAPSFSSSFSTIAPLEQEESPEEEPNPDELKELINQHLAKNKKSILKKVISFPYKQRLITIKFYHYIIPPNIVYQIAPSVLGLSSLMLASVHLPHLYFPLILALSRGKSLMSSVSGTPPPEETHLSNIEAQAYLTKKLKQAENVIKQLKQQSMLQKSLLQKGKKE